MQMGQQQSASASQQLTDCSWAVSSHANNEKMRNKQPSIDYFRMSVSCFSKYIISRYIYTYIGRQNLLFSNMEIRHELLN